jgi:hypothetical protein
MTELDPRNLIDRDAERELFGELIKFSTPARMLTICDTGGRGKSSLLKRLKYNCRYEAKPQAIPACLIELDKLNEPSGFELIRQIVNDDGLTVQVDGVAVRERFTRFNAHDRALRFNDPTFFTSESAMNVHLRSIAKVGGPVAEGAIVAGTLMKNPIIQLENRSEFTGDQRQLARQMSVGAFFDDLREVCATQPLVIIFDAWERCNVDLRKWIRDEFLDNHWRSSDPVRRPDQLAIVVAGRPFDPRLTPHGLKPDEFLPLFSDVEEYEVTVRSIGSLSEWTPDHIRDFLEMNGCTEFSDHTIAFIQERLQAGLSLEKIVTLVQEYVLRKT